MDDSERSEESEFTETLRFAQGDTGFFNKPFRPAGMPG
jgi:hypothetical protein